MLTLGVIAALTLTPAAPSAPAGSAASRRSCTQWDKRGWPSKIRVHLIHKRGSSVPARVVTVDFDEYVGRVLASGAAPAHKPMAALRAMALVVAARSAWMISHPQRGYSWRGRCYDIHSGTARRGLAGADHGQFYRPGQYVHSRIRRAVAWAHGTQMRRSGRLAKPQWTGGAWSCGAGYTGNRLPANGAGRCARQGRSTAWIMRRYFPRVRLVRG